MSSESVLLPTNPLYRNAFLRTLSNASSFGAESGECFRALHDAGTSSQADWSKAWSTLASRLDQHAEVLLTSNPPQRYSAKLAYLRAANYHRTAFAPAFGYPLVKDFMPSYGAMATSFANAAKLFDPPLTRIEIPFNGVNLSGYLANPPKETASNDRLLVVISGYDAPMEEVYFFCSHHAMSRGYSVLVFDGPGQGSALLELGLKMAHVYDEVLSSVLATAANHGHWKQTVVMGLSLGGLLCLQAVASPKNQARIHAVVADPAELNLIDAFRARLPFPQSICEQLPAGPPWAAAMLSFLMNRLSAGQGMAGWALRRGMLVHGCETPMEYLRELPAFDNGPILGQIKIPTLITRAEKDQIGDQAETVYERLTDCEKKTMIVFKDEEGAAEHCQTGARMLFSEKVFAWLDSTLS